MNNFEVRIVLVRPLYDRNIGAVSRAMTNMGASKLILINRQCEITYDAQQSAASGQNPLAQRAEYGAWADFLSKEPPGIRIGLTARDGKMRQVRDLGDSLKWIKANESPQFIDLVFGPEDWGLSSEDLDNCHIAATIPTFGDNTSLNLSQAALLALYILRTELGGQKTQLEGQQPPRSSNSSTLFPDEALKTWITEMGFKVENRKVNAYSVMKKMLMSTVPTTKELRILEIVLNQGIRKLREYNELYKEKRGQK